MNSKTARKLAWAMLPALLLSVGCGKESTDEAVAKDCKPTAQVQTIHKGKLTAWVADYPPFVYQEDGELKGPDGELLTQLAKDLCLSLDAKTQQFAAVIEGLRSGKADISAGQWAFDEKRAETFEVSEPVYSMGGAIISHKKISSVEQLKGLKVGTPQGYAWVEDFQQLLGSDLRLFQSERAVLADIEAGRLDAGIFDRGSGGQLVADSSAELNIVELPKDERIEFSLKPAVSVVLVKKGNTALRDAVDATVGAYRSSGGLANALQQAGMDASFATPPANP